MLKVQEQKVDGISNIKNLHTVAQMRVRLTCTFGTYLEYHIINNRIKIIECEENVVTGNKASLHKREKRIENVDEQRKYVKHIYESWVTNAKKNDENASTRFKIYMNVTLYANVNATSIHNNNHIIKLKGIEIDLRKNVDKEYIELLLNTL